MKDLPIENAVESIEKFSKEFKVNAGVKTISYPFRDEFYRFNFFDILSMSYKVDDNVENCSSSAYVNISSRLGDFCENDTVVILKGDDDEHYSATYLNGGWVVTGDYNLDINDLIEPGMGIILTVERPGTISWRAK